MNLLMWVPLKLWGRLTNRSKSPTVHCTALARSLTVMGYLRPFTPDFVYAYVSIVRKTLNVRNR